MQYCYTVHTHIKSILSSKTFLDFLIFYLYKFLACPVEVCARNYEVWIREALLYVIAVRGRIAVYRRFGGKIWKIMSWVG